MAAMEDGRPTEQAQCPRLGRPRKPPHEKRRKQQEATKWRDARRVYLGNSYDRWKKVKSRIGLKDCSLAWHLMEAHDSHCVECGRGADLGWEEDDTPRNFFPQLIKSIRRICLQYLTFQHTVEVVGLVCLEIDKGTKENFSIKELVNRPIGLRVEALASKHKSTDNDFEIELANDYEDDDDDNIDDDEDDMSDGDASNDESGTDVPDIKNTYEETKTIVQEVSDIKGGNSFSTALPADVRENHIANCDSNASQGTPRSSEGGGSRSGSSSLNIAALSSMQDNPWASSLHLITQSAKLDVPSVARGKEVESIDSPLDMAVVKIEQKSDSDTFASTSDLDCATNNQGLTSHPHPFSERTPHIATSVPTLDTPVPAPVAEQQTSPIDLKVVKQEASDLSQHPPHETAPAPTPPRPDLSSSRLDLSSPAHTPENSLLGKKRKFICVEPGLGSHKKEVFHKEEYEVLEMTPFTDYAEFSRHCPTVLQRTFYRWKRRIKDEYIFLEQHPELTYQEYLHYVPHAKENVFNFWKSLIKKRYLFGPGSASHQNTTLSLKSDNDGRKSSPLPHSTIWDEENHGGMVLKFMQKNLTADYQEVVKHFPSFPEHVYKIWKQQNLQAWKFLEQNFTLDYPLYSRCFPIVSEEVFNSWRQGVLRESRNKIMSLQREAVSTAEHIQDAQKALWTSLISQRLAQEQSRFSANPASWSNMPGGWMGEYPGFWGTALNLSTLSRMDQSQLGQLQANLHRAESAKTVSNTNLSSKSDSVSPLPFKKSEDEGEAGFMSKSKKQNKAEYYLYLQNPKMDYSDMNSQHPSVSLRTFYRWKKEIKTALAYVNEVPGHNFETFHSYFPEIPKEIYYQWKKASQESQEPGRSSLSESQGQQESVGSEEDPDVESIDDDERDENLNMKTGEEKGRKENQQQFLYLQMNPTVDFADFTYQFPNISMDTFYKWRTQIQNQMNAVRKNPDISLADIQSVCCDVTEDILSVWKKVVRSEKEFLNGLNFKDMDENTLNLSHQDKENVSEDNHMQKSLNNKRLKLSPSRELPSVRSNSPSNRDLSNTPSPRGITGRTLMKTGRQEYLFLIQNPDIDLHTFLGMFPDMSSATFYRWRREMKAVLDFMASFPSATYQDVKTEFPEVSLDMYTQWRERLNKSSVSPGQQESSKSQEENPIKSLQALVNDGDTYVTKQTCHNEPGFLYLLENPNTSLLEFNKLYPAVSAGVFSRWKKLVKDWFMLLKADIDFKTFSYYCNEVPEHVFNKWKSLVKRDKAEESVETEGVVQIGGQSIHSPEDWVMTKTRKVNQTEYLFFLMNPYMDYNEFAVTFPLISLRTFYRWRREIRESLEYLEQYPNVSYKAFFQVFPVVPEEVFNKWKELCAEQNRKVEVSSESLRKSLHYHDPDSASSKVDAGGSGTDNDDGQTHQATKPVLPAHRAVDVDVEDESMFSVDSPDNPGIVTSLSSTESLSAAVESICRSAGLPPLDENMEDLSAQQTSAANNSSSSVLGGVAFPGMSSAQTKTTSSHDLSVSTQLLELKHEEPPDDKSDFSVSTPPPTATSNLGAITFPGMSSLPAYSEAGFTPQMMKEESFFSPRARKQSREEYLFLQQNPGMDFQEFCSHYPTISLRTFYRWKREFRQSHEYMVGLHSSLQ